MFNIASPRHIPHTHKMAFFVFFNLARMLMYESTCKGTTITSELNNEFAEFVSTPLAASIDPIQVTFAYDGYYPAYPFAFAQTSAITTIADLVNNWNAQAVKLGNHGLAMTPDYSDPTFVYMSNISDMTAHLWIGNVYVGLWAPREIRHVSISEFTSPTPASTTSPIIVSQDTPILNVTAYLYRRTKTGGFYTKTETVTIPAGFYANTYSFVAMMNATIKIRGERNGFIYHFICDSNGNIGVEATHRQPEPSMVVFEQVDLLACMNIGIFDTINLPLRTAKRVHFNGRVSHIL